ncbi:MAG: hypothetical protein AB7O52_14355 [Planctomycetota bacterium]
MESRGVRRSLRHVTLAAAFAIFAFVDSAAAMNALYRLRVHTETRPGSNALVSATVYLDNTTYPMPAGGDPNAALRTVHGVFFGLQVPNGYELVSYRVGAAITQALQGQAPFLQSIQTVPGGLTFAIILDDQRLLGIPAGHTQPVLDLTLRAISGPLGSFDPRAQLAVGGTPPGPAQLRPVDTLGSPLVPIALNIAGGGTVRPGVRGIVLGDATVSVAASAGPGFPTPTPDELVVQALGTASGFAGDDPTSSTPCDFDPPLGTSADWDLTVCGTPGPGCPSPQCGPGPVYPTITAALQAYLSQPSPPAALTIRVMPGTYHENIVMDMSQFLALVRIYSEAGPSCTIIDGGGVGPCVELVQSGFAGGIIWFGAADTEDPTGWRGFTLRNGAAVRGAGMSLREQSHQVRIMGNIIGDPALPNVAEEAGGGVYVLGGNHTWLALNEIRDNIVLGTSGPGYRGAGVAFDPAFTKGSTWLTLQKNDIHGNEFASGGEPPSGLPRQGGGVYVNADALFETTVLRMCSNQIYDNNAVQGGGVFVRTRSSGPRVVASIVDNRIFENDAWLPTTSVTTSEGYQGGGLYLSSRDRSRVLVIHNDIYQNESHVDDGLPSVVPSLPPHQVGGGLYVAATLDSDDDEHALAITGNFVHDNRAAYQGGGAYLALFDDSLSGGARARFHTNSVTGNRLLGAAPFPQKRGSGTYFAASLLTVPAANFGASFDASSNIVWGNEPPTPTGALDAYAEGFAAGSGPFRYSHLEAATVGVAPLFGPECADVNPGVMNLYTDPHLANDNSPCVDSGDPLLTVGDLISDTDIDGENRFIDIPSVGPSILDRGADEFMGAEFIRGLVNPNSSGTISIADVVIILGFLFSFQPLPCLDAADVNDDGVVNLLDPIYLLDYYYFSGPLPAAPYFSCGTDPTVDSLGCISAPLCP